MQTPEKVVERLVALDEWVKHYDLQGNSYTQFWVDYAAIDPDLQSYLHRQAKLPDEVMQHYDIVRSSLDRRGLYGRQAPRAPIHP